VPLLLGHSTQPGHIAHNDPDLSDDDRDAARAKKELTAGVLKWIANVVSSVPEPGPDGDVLLQEVVDAALGLKRQIEGPFWTDRNRSALRTHILASRLTDSPKWSRRSRASLEDKPASNEPQTDGQVDVLECLLTEMTPPTPLPCTAVLR
jgi:hypothetical protein